MTHSSGESARLLARTFAEVASRRRRQHVARVATIVAATTALVLVAVDAVTGTAVGPATRLAGSLLAGALAAGVTWWLTARPPISPAAALERRLTDCRNVLITAEALLDGRVDARPPVQAVVIDDAARKVSTIALSDLWPWRPILGLVTAAAVVWCGAVLVPTRVIEPLLSSAAEAAAMPTITNIDVVITPPEYTGQPAETVINPERISGVVGSRVQVRVTTSAASVSLETASETLALTPETDQVLVGSVVLTTDGYLAMAPQDDEGRAGPRRLIGVTALVDQNPTVQVVEPGKDLYLPDGNARIPIQIRGTDDFGLQALRMTYTKVAGSGESFTFTEGTIPVQVTEVSAREWTAVGVLPLETMGLEVGDMVVYRAIASDRRPEAPEVESDAFIVEIVSSSEAMAEGFTIDDDRDKYALSQQMVILKTERLIAKAGSLSPGDLEQEALGIAAEQRSVRAEIVFMMGGEFEDEAVEASHEHELSAGRLDNSGRADLGIATRAMSRASTQLISLELTPALETERAALVAMQRALSRRRFILRTLTQRQPIDEGRRLQGTLSDLGRGARQVDDAVVGDRVAALRSALQVVTRLGRQSSWSMDDAAMVSDVAAGVLRADARSADVVDTAGRLTMAGELMVSGESGRVAEVLTDAAMRLTTLVAIDLAAAPTSAVSPEVARLQGALADALRAGGRR